MHFVLHLIARICLVPAFSFLSVDPETAVDAEYDYVPDDQFASAELPGKQTPLIIPISPILSLYIHALDFATIIVPVAPTLMHSLVLPPAVDTLPVIL